MSNAPPSTSHAALQETVMDVIPHPQDRALLHQRHTEAVVEIRAGEQVGHFQPTHVSGMGDGNACELFVRSFLRPIESWRDQPYQDVTQFQDERLLAPVPLVRATSLMTCALPDEMHD
eukprot:7874958-Pyramimonas_sp.AAC.1